MRFIVSGIATTLALASPAWAANNFDGLYDGTAQVRSGRCGPPQVTSFRVTGNHISHHFGAQNQIEADIGPDGTVSTTTAAIRTTTTGSVSGGAMVLDITTPGCTFHFDLKKT